MLQLMVRLKLFMKGRIRLFRKVWLALVRAWYFNRNLNLKYNWNVMRKCLDKRKRVLEHMKSKDHVIDSDPILKLATEMADYLEDYRGCLTL